MRLHRLSKISPRFQRPARSERQDDAGLPGPWLLTGRIAWVCVSGLTLCMTVMSLPFAFERLQFVCIQQQPCPVYALSARNIEQLHALGLSASFYATYFLMLVSVNFLIWFGIAAVLFWRKSTNPIVLLSAFFLVTGAPVTILQLGGHSSLGTPGWRITGGLLILLGQYLSDPFLCLFPNGRFVPRWTRTLVLVELIVDLLLLFCNLFVPVWYSLLSKYFLLLSCVTIVCFGAQIYRYKYVSNEVQRQQSKWAFLGICIFVLGDGGPGAIFYQTVRDTSLLLLFLSLTVIYLCSIVLPISIWIAISRTRLWDIDRIINRTLLYGLLTTCVVGIYSVVVAGLSLLFQVQSNFFISLLATGLVAVCFQPLHERLQQVINRITYGERDNPSALLTRLGKSVEATLTPEATLSALVETAARALKLPYVAITFAQEPDSVPVVSYGKPCEKCLRFPLVYQSQQVGQLVLAQRAPDEEFTPADLCIFADVARQVGVIAYAAHLTTDLQHSRERLVSAREEERRRLRRDLHDGLGPTLAGFSLKVGAVRNLLLPGQEVANTFLNELSTDIEEAIRDIRRIVYNLRPPSLDELGLVGALKVRAAHYSDLNVMVQVPQQLPALSAAIEVAVYLIVQEALTNVARHAEASTCRVILTVDREVSIEIIDDGRGLPTELRCGVGLLAMRERAAELGGTCVIEAAQPRGTRVSAHLPILEE